MSFYRDGRRDIYVCCIDDALCRHDEHAICLRPTVIRRGQICMYVLSLVVKLM